MLEFLVLLLVLLIGGASLYYVYDRVYRKSSVSQPTLYVEALRDLLDNKLESAFTKLRQVVAEDPNNLDAYLRLGQILREHNHPQRALQIHKDLTLRFGLTRERKVAILRELAADYLALNDYATADAALKELLSLDSDNYWAYAQRLKMQEKLLQYEDAYDLAVQILRLESNKSKKPLAHYKYLQGEQLLKKREHHRARVAFKEAISLDPTYVPAYLAIGDSYAEEERLEDAITFWTKLIAAVPEQGHQVIDRLRNTLFALGRYGDILDMCQSILEVSPKNVEARVALSEFHAKKGDLEAAAEALEQAVDERPNDPNLLLDLIRLYLERNDRGKLLELRRALERRRDKGKIGSPRPNSQPTPSR